MDRDNHSKVVCVLDLKCTVNGIEYRIQQLIHKNSTDEDVEWLKDQHRILDVLLVCAVGLNNWIQKFVWNNLLSIFFRSFFFEFSAEKTKNIEIGCLVKFANKSSRLTEFNWTLVKHGKYCIERMVENSNSNIKWEQVNEVQ